MRRRRTIKPTWRKKTRMGWKVIRETIITLCKQGELQDYHETVTVKNLHSYAKRFGLPSNVIHCRYGFGDIVKKDTIKTTYVYGGSEEHVGIRNLKIQEKLLEWDIDYKKDEWNLESGETIEFHLRLDYNPVQFRSWKTKMIEALSLYRAIMGNKLQFLNRFVLKLPNPGRFKEIAFFVYPYPHQISDEYGRKVLIWTTELEREVIHVRNFDLRQHWNLAEVALLILASLSIIGIVDIFLSLAFHYGWL